MRALLEKGLKFCPNNRVDPFTLFLDLHQFVRKLTLKRHFNIMGSKKNNTEEPPSNKESNQQLRQGKYINIKGKSTFYPVESQGHLLKTFPESVQEDFREIGAIKDSKHMKKNLTREEERALKNVRIST